MTRLGSGPSASFYSSEINQYVFFTRPELNLSGSTLALDRNFHSLNVFNPNSTAFMIRALLDPVFAKRHEKLCLQSQLLNYYSPFIIPMTNMLTDISGWPEYSLETESSEGGFFCENLTHARGSDRLARSYDINVGFVDLPYGPIRYLILFWLLYIDRVAMGDFVPYSKNINQRRCDYSTGIYVINVEPTGNYITSFAKGTFGFPKSFPFGDLFSFSTSEIMNKSLNKFSIPFTINFVKYFPDYLPLLMFNHTVDMFAKGVASDRTIDINDKDALKRNEGFIIPYINSTKRGYQLVWKSHGRSSPGHPDAANKMMSDDLTNYFDKVLNKDGIAEVVERRKS